MIRKKKLIGSSFSQVSFNFLTLFVSFSPSAIQHFFFSFHSFNLYIFYDIICLDYGELSKEPGDSFCLIKKFDFNIVSVWKYFNFLTYLQPRTFILYVHVKITKSL